ncbi:flagellar biosynthesis repressor FlbT [Cognatishimia sp. F0-27]|uniref:flagellar biosynthesis repressor FlbT n=1 Tax=Cognatishimia sp. F0-27 TaxID=2816855 RepID=UPI001D0CC43C|nr:flagellar biosynthesis repressor FlbT [Cognatishimia sp. F0-27]MCC1492898.1 flagellar biosynthesis repressor FlbT [Cognatishimia sp. F0-27]
MTGLVLKLGPRERVLINGAVIENGDRRSRLSIVTPNANILRLRDAIHPDEATTPVRRVCYSAQLMLTGDTSGAGHQTRLLREIEELSRVFTDYDSRSLLNQATEALLEDHPYRCLKALRGLLAREDRLIAARRDNPAFMQTQ